MKRGPFRNRVYVGTSGWTYPHWKESFYPAELPDRQRLDYYARHFDSVEINNSFYHLPTEKSLHDWCERVPKRFVFAVKASRYITHMKKLKDPEQSLNRFVERIEVLGGRLGPVLFQLPPRWRCNRERLAEFSRRYQPA